MPILFLKGVAKKKKKNETQIQNLVFRRLIKLS